MPLLCPTMLLDMYNPLLMADLNNSEPPTCLHPFKINSTADETSDRSVWWLCYCRMKAKHHNSQQTEAPVTKGKTTVLDGHGKISFFLHPCQKGSILRVYDPCLWDKNMPQAWTLNTIVFITKSGTDNFLPTSLTRM